MNDEPAKSMLDAASQSGWVIALLTSTWGIVLRFVVGRYTRAADRLEDRLIGIENRIANIESRSHSRRRGDYDDN